MSLLRPSQYFNALVPSTSIIHENPNFLPKVIVGEALITKGFHLKVVAGTVDILTYCQIISDFITYAISLLLEGWLLQPDGGAPFSKYSQEFLRVKSWKSLKWPDNSPDLSPIRNSWTILKDMKKKENQRKNWIQSMHSRLLQAQFEEHSNRIH